MSMIEKAAADGFQVGADAYVRGRPDYPQALGTWLRDSLRLGPGKHTLDLGAGTGKFTPLLIATGAHVVAVEPVEAMRAKLAAAFPHIAALGSTAEAIPVPNGSVDAVVCAQAFHWFATRAALADIHRVISPGGKIGLVWNWRDDTVPWVAKLSTLILPYEGNTPRFNSGRWRDVFPAPGYSDLEETRLPHVHTGPAEQVIIDRALSVSFIAALPKDEQAILVARIRKLIESEPELAGKPQVSFPYVTLAYAATRL
jgi:ubiquinone/menaquinone biosynthesis C-methylase UbiE